MNYLAHVYLSCDNEKLLLGNLIADFIRNKDLIGLNEQLIKGVELHRSIDSFTDSHLYFLASSRKFYSNHHKYAPVLTDIIYDYILVQNWNKYSDISIDDFVQKVYHTIEKNLHLLSQNLVVRLNKMITSDFLMFSASKNGLQKTFEYMDRRTKFPSNFTNAILDLEMNYDILESNFNKFFPELRKHVEQYCSCENKLI